MNEHVGVLQCPHCSSLWHDGQWQCSVCGNREPPPALKAPGPPWAWWAAAVVAVMAWGIDRHTFGGAGWHALRHWLDSMK
jgi:hypothetical protein